MQNNIVKQNQILNDLLSDFCFNQSHDEWKILLADMLKAYSDKKSQDSPAPMEISNKLFQVQYLCSFIKKLKAQQQFKENKQSKLFVLLDNIDLDFFEESIFSGLNYWIYDDGSPKVDPDYFSKISNSFNTVSMLISEYFTFYGNNVD